MINPDEVSVRTIHILDDTMKALDELQQYSKKCLTMGNSAPCNHSHAEMIAREALEKAKADLAALVKEVEDALGF